MGAIVRLRILRHCRDVERCDNDTLASVKLVGLNWSRLVLAPCRLLPT
jgi:hypothetical protein